MNQLGLPKVQPQLDFTGCLPKLDNLKNYLIRNGKQCRSWKKKLLAPDQVLLSEIHSAVQLKAIAQKFYRSALAV